MPEGSVHLALFKEIDPAAIALDKLRELGIQEKDMTIISGAPYSEKMLGRPGQKTQIPIFAGVGFIGGFILSILMNWGTPFLYPVHVGGLPLYPIPTTLVLTFEMCMLGLLLSTFLGVIWECAFPALGPMEYHPKISDGQIAVVFNCPVEVHERAHAALGELGAEWVHRTEATKL